MHKTQIHAEIVAHSRNLKGDELLSVLCTFPRIILAEINTHRMLSKNTSSSRAIPFNKMVQAIQENPFIPIAWQRNHSGMQGTEYKEGDSEIQLCINKWMEARDNAIQSATLLNTTDQVTKQLCNRILEPFMWTTMLITGPVKGGWDNFFNLRCPDYQFPSLPNKSFKSKKEVLKENGFAASLSDLEWLQSNKGHAEIHIMNLAEKIYDALQESTPKELKPGEWHIPFEDKFPTDDVLEGILNEINYVPKFIIDSADFLTTAKINISTAMAARTSYTLVGGESSLSPEKLITLHDILIAQDPPHSSPMEHCAKTMTEYEYEANLKGTIPVTGIIIEEVEGWCRNFRGFIPYRHIIEEEYN